MYNRRDLYSSREIRTVAGNYRDLYSVSQLPREVSQVRASQLPREASARSARGVGQVHAGRRPRLIASHGWAMPMVRKGTQWHKARRFFKDFATLSRQARADHQTLVACLQQRRGLAFAPTTLEPGGDDRKVLFIIALKRVAHITPLAVARSTR